MALRAIALDIRELAHSVSEPPRQPAYAVPPTVRPSIRNVG